MEFILQIEEYLVRPNRELGHQFFFPCDFWIDWEEDDKIKIIFEFLFPADSVYILISWYMLIKHYRVNVHSSYDSTILSKHVILPLWQDNYVQEHSGMNRKEPLYYFITCSMCSIKNMNLNCIIQKVCKLYVEIL